MSFGFFKKNSTISFYSTTDQNYIYKEGVLLIAVDNFPTELPKEATQYFGDNLLPFLEALVKSDSTKPFDQQTGTKQKKKR